MKILRPINVSKRLPENQSDSVDLEYFITVDDNGYKNHAHYSAANEEWIDKESQIVSDVILWYEEVEIESLFPDEDKIYNTACAATNNQSVKTMFYQEGCSFFKNYILKMLK